MQRMRLSKADEFYTQSKGRLFWRRDGENILRKGQLCIYNGNGGQLHMCLENFQKRQMITAGEFLKSSEENPIIYEGHRIFCRQRIVVVEQIS